VVQLLSKSERSAQTLCRRKAYSLRKIDATEKMVQACEALGKK
jgi:hypothetical protein